MNTGALRYTFVALTSAFLGLAGCGGSSGGDRAPPAQPPAQPPPAAVTVSIDAPSTATVNRTTPLTATVNVPAGVTVTSVEFLVDGTSVGSASASPYTVNWDTSAVADGDHSVTARVTDSLSRIVTSSAVTYAVANTLIIPIEVSSAEVLPTIQSDATASGELTFNLLTGAVAGGVTIEGMTATLAHIHRGFAGVNGPVVVDFEADPANSARWNAVSGGMLSAEDIDNLLAGALYVNVHSAAHPAGEIRGQIQPDHITVVYSPMSHDQVVPPAPDAASGTVAATINANTSTATIHTITSSLVEPTSAHVHSAAMGANSTASLFDLTQAANDPNHWLAESQEISAEERQAFDANEWYVDVHTTGLPNGAVRGQILATPPTPPAPSPPAPPSPPTPPTPPTPPAPTLAELQQSVFTPVCSGCHSGVGGDLPGAMNLSNAAASFAALVNVPSSEQPALMRVEPNDSANSYLVHKIEGAPTITGARMPLGGPPLDQATIDRIKAWIDAGAANN